MTAYYNENDPFAAQWLRNLIAAGQLPGGDVDERDIRDVIPAELTAYTQCHFFAGVGIWALALRNAEWSDNRRVWTGSCPCQPFSAAGKGDGFDDERHLWPAWHHLIRECRPEEIFFEQVASKDGLGWLDLVSADLEGEDYARWAVDICVAGVGAPHIRQRLFGYAYDTRFATGGLEHGARDGREERRAESGGRGIVGGCIPSGLVNSIVPGLEGHAGHGHSGREPGRIATQPGGPVAATGDSGRMADSTSRNTCTERIQRSGQHGQFAEDGVPGGMPRPAGPVNGFWGNADWLFCRDGKWRPVEPLHVKVVDGDTGSMGCSGTEEETPEEINENVQKLSKAFDPKTLPERSFRRQQDVQPQGLLQSEVHGAGLRRHNQTNERQKQSSPVGQNPESGMPVVRAERTPCSSSERNSHRQRPAKLDDLVRFLPCSLSLAEIYGRRETASELQALRETIVSEGSLPYSPVQVQAAWASFSKETKDRIAMGFDATRWVVVETRPLTENSDQRVGKLRGYGNAICPQAAEEIIRSVI